MNLTMVLRYTLFLCFTGLWSHAAAITQVQHLQDLIDDKSSYILDVLNNKTIDKPEKNSRILIAADEIIDFDLMAKLSLGETGWSQLTAPQKSKYLSLFQDRIKNLYLGVLHLYTNEKVRVAKATQTGATRISVPSYITDGSTERQILYKFYRNKNKDWLIYDIKIEGVSIVQTYRFEFAEFLKKASVSDLIVKLGKDLRD